MFLFSCTFVELVRLFLFFGVRSFPCLFVHPHFNSWGIDYLFLSLSSAPPTPVCFDRSDCLLLFSVDELSARHLNKEAIYQCTDA